MENVRTYSVKIWYIEENLMTYTKKAVEAVTPKHYVVIAILFFNIINHKDINRILQATSTNRSPGKL